MTITGDVAMYSGQVGFTPSRHALTEQQCRAALIVVCRHARNRADAIDLLEVLGLDDFALSLHLASNDTRRSA